MSSEKPLVALLRQIELSLNEEDAISFDIRPITNEVAKGLWGGYGTNSTCTNIGCNGGLNKTCQNDQCNGGIENNGCTNQSCS